MSETLLVVDNPDRWSLQLPNARVVSARAYLTDPEFSGGRRRRVLNLCRSYRYQALGYYVSLLAEARGHRPLPSIATIQDLKSQSIVRVVSGDLDEHIQKSLEHLHASQFTLSIYFARNVAKRYDTLARRLYSLFPAPLLRAYFLKNEEGWTLQSISPIPASEIPEDHRSSVIDLATEYFANRPSPTTRKPSRYDMALLIDEAEDLTAPSDPKAIEKFRRAAEALSISTEIIGKDDYDRIPEFDALFIRMTTAVNNAAYRFARKAQAEGLIVIDDPQSIVRCTNKVFLAELLERHEIPAPATLIVHRDNVGEVPQCIGLPCILKKPDSSFSQGVVKVATEAELAEKVEALLDDSELVIAQQFVPTDFDWRIGILDGKPLFCAKYFMARGHWQIYNHSKDDDDVYGRAKAVPLELTPQRVVKTALKAANLIGNGLYGVDLKQTEGGRCFVIEVNDNPSIEAGIEDQLMRDALYERIMEVFLKRLDALREGRA